jgi:Co/Zn/Cd efflux system component
MGHDHTHEHGHSQHHADSPKTYAKAGWVGMCGFVFEGGIGFALAGSVGAVGDALHALMDALAFFLSARYARLQSAPGNPQKDYQKLSVQMQSAFLVAAILLLAANLWLGNDIIEFSSVGMFVAALSGLGFNIIQMNILGRSMGKGMNRHESARQHAFLDVLFSCVVIHGALINFLKKIEGWEMVKIGVVLGLVLVMAIGFVQSGFIDFANSDPWKRWAYLFGVMVGGGASVVLLIHGSEKDVDRAVGCFLFASMIASLLINAVALARWGRGGNTWLHVH